MLSVALLLLAQSAPPEGFTSLFDGETLAGWRGRPQLDARVEEAMDSEELAKKQLEWNADRDKHWRVEDGEIVNDGHGLFLTTEKDYGDFSLTLEYKTVAGADSGIYLRGCPQVQIWDTNEEGGKWNLGADKGSGSLWNNQKGERFPLAHADKPFGEWNRLQITMLGERVWVMLNGKPVVSDVRLENYFDRSLPVPARGPIQLQTHGGEIRWRKLSITELTPGPREPFLGSEVWQGDWTKPFDGESLDGWAGAVDGYEVVDGALRCKPGAGGTIYTEEEFEDFVVKFHFRLPPGGNNGLAIRYPGSGDTAYVGMCELQVLDNTAEKYSGLKDYQYHGSAYGMVPAHRGYLLPVGEWNEQRVTVQGSTIQVELNNTIILDCDLAEIEKPMSGNKHPGRTRTSGHFGFAGHGDAVEFKDVWIKRLPKQPEPAPETEPSKL